MRPRSHVQETESKQAFERAIPSSWVTRQQTPDYGIDYQVEVFRNDVVTPWQFNAQLKSTDGIESSDENPTQVFATERLKQYLASAVPVMLVLYDSKGRRLWYLWSHKWWRGMSAVERARLDTQESLTIAFSRRLDQLGPSLLESEIRREALFLGQTRPADHFVSFRLYQVPPGNSGLTRKVFQSLAGVASRQRIQFDDGVDVDGLVEFDEATDSLKLGDNSQGTIRLSDAGSILGENQEEQTGSLTMAIAFVLSRVGLASITVDLVTHVVEAGALLGPLGRFMLFDPDLAELFAAQGRAADALLLAKELCNQSAESDAVVLATAALHGGKRFANGFREILMLALARATSPVSRARLHYSLGNSYRSQGHFVKAIACYRRARADDPKYQLRGYWWGELAGCLFSAQRLAASEQAYRIAVLLGVEEIPVQGLLGDVLIARRKFRDARIELEAYMHKATKPLAGLIVAYAAASSLEAIFGPVGRERSDAAALLEQSNAPADPEEAVAFYRAVLDQDPLSALAWHNLTVALANSRDASAHEMAMIAATVASWDVGSWALAVVHLPSDAVCAGAVVFEAYRKFGPELEEVIRRNFNVLERPVEDLIASRRRLESSVRSLFTSDDSVTVRFT